MHGCSIYKIFKKRLMKKRYLIILIFYSSIATAQLSIESIDLPKKIDETSGLEYFRGHFITHNDSGGKSKLYSFTSEGDLIKSHNIKGAKNRDWEELTADNNYIYICDTGNNYATRKDLKIYKVDKDLILKDSILIRYKNQKSFKRKSKNRYDAEAIASVDSILLLFSKDRKRLTTQVYSIPKEANNYVLSPIAEFKVDALVTAADYDPISKTLALTSYTYEGDQYLYRFLNFDIKKIKSLKFEKFIIPVKPAQIEAVKVEDSSTFWITSEDEGEGSPRLFKACIE